MFAIEGIRNLKELQAKTRLLIDSHPRVQVPTEDFNTVAVGVEDCCMIYDIRRGGYIRKIETPGVFCMDGTGRFLVFDEGQQLVFKLVRLPASYVLVELLRPKYQNTDDKVNVAQATESKQSYKDRLYKDMFLYHMYQADPVKASKSNVTQQQNFQLLVLKYQEALATPYKLKANREFLMLQKILLRD